MKKKVLCWAFIALLFSCGKGVVDPEIEVHEEEPELPEEFLEFSENELIGYKGLVEMVAEPHDLLAEGKNLYMVSGSTIFYYQLSNRGMPALKKEYLSGENDVTFGNLYFTDGKLYVPCLGDQHLYEFNADLTLSKKYALDGITNFRPKHVLIDENGFYWFGGNDAGYPVVAKYKLSNGAMTLEGYWRDSFVRSNIEGLVNHGEYIMVGNARGELFAILKTASEIKPTQYIVDIPGGALSMIVQGDMAYWAHYSAGLVSVDQDVKQGAVLTTHAFKAQFPEAGDITAYDVVYHEKWESLCITNGRGGLVLTKTDPVDRAVDYIDLEDFDLRCVATAGDYIYAGNRMVAGAGTDNTDNKNGIAVFKRIK